MNGRLWRLAFLGTAVLAIYSTIGHWPRQHPLVLEMPHWVPFVPELAPPYLALLLLGWFLPLAIRDSLRFRRCLFATTVALLLIAPWWLIVPTVLPRPTPDPGWGTLVYRWLILIDAPTNIMPCAHAVTPLTAAWFLSQERPNWWPWLLAMLLIGLPSIAMTWQHRPSDIAWGCAMAAVGIVIAEYTGARKLNKITLSGE